MPDYKDPKVTTTTGRSTVEKKSTGRWIGIAAAVVVVLLLLLWLFGVFSGPEEIEVAPGEVGETETLEVEPDAAVEPEAPEIVEPAN